MTDQANRGNSRPLQLVGGQRELDNGRLQEDTVASQEQFNNYMVGVSPSTPGNVIALPGRPQSQSSASPNQDSEAVVLQFKPKGAVSQPNNVHQLSEARQAKQGEVVRRTKVAQIVAKLIQPVDRLHQ